MSRIRVVLVDDHAVLRDGLRSAINNQPDMQVVGEAATGLEVPEVVRQTNPRVICLDLSLPGMSGIQVIESLRGTCPAGIVVLTMHDDPAYLRSALAAGCSGYVLKASQVSVLFSAIRAVATGGRYVDENLAMHLSGTASARQNLVKKVANSGSPVDLLSGREHEVMTYLAQGHTHQEIAEKLSVSIKSVETYRARIREKTGLRTRADFVRFGLEIRKSEGPDKLEEGEKCGGN